MIQFAKQTERSEPPGRKQTSEMDAQAQGGESEHMVAMVKWLSQRVVVPFSWVRIPLATPQKSDLEMGRILV